MRKSIILCLFAFVLSISNVKTCFSASLSKEKVASELSKIDWSGDVRLRAEGNWNRDNLPDRYREVFRLRLGAPYPWSKSFELGARIATGAQNDPNSTDVTLGNVSNDFDISLDYAYVKWMPASWFDVLGGRFKNPFTKTELIWDGDVNPQGVASTFKWNKIAFLDEFKLNGLFFSIDEGDSDSWMLGEQVVFKKDLTKKAAITLATSYLNYRLSAAMTADTGDSRTNAITNTNLTSDFDMWDVLAQFNYALSKNWPLKLVFNFVKNFDENIADDTRDKGYWFDSYIGKKSKKGDLRFRYGYADVAQDAVLAAFTQDNIDLGTNYRGHTAAIDYMIYDKLAFNLTTYVFQRKVIGPTATTDEKPWVTRLRLNLVWTFF